MLWLIPVILVSAFALSGPVMSNVEQAQYSVVRDDDDDFEIRDYAPMIVAETEVSGERKEAIRQGFKLIADYIFGNNQSRHKVAMTAPVVQNAEVSEEAGDGEGESQSIAMTAPVTQQSQGNNWKVRFVMPREYTLDTLPQPNNPQVKLQSIPGRRMAVVSFSGIPDNDDLKTKEAELLTYVQGLHLSVVSVPAYAFYNPPWTLPFFRRNEVMLEVEPSGEE